MGRGSSHFIGILVMVAFAGYFLGVREDIFVKASNFNMNGIVSLRLSRSTHHVQFHQLSATDEIKITKELIKVHQIQEKVSGTYISANGDLMMTLAKSTDQSLILVVFKNQHIQMIQKVTDIEDRTLKLAYGEVTVQPEKVQMALSQNVEIDF